MLNPLSSDKIEGVKANIKYQDKALSYIFHQDILNVKNTSIAKIQPIVGPNGVFYGMLLVVALATRFSVGKSFMAWLSLMVLEDLCYWIAQWIDTGVYPFQAPNWWDSGLATFRLLGGLGQAIPFWPYVPLYYIPGFTLLIIYYITSYKSAKYGRIIEWIIGPFILAILAGALPGIFGLTSDLLATIILIILPTISYLFVLSLLYRNDWKFKEK